MQPTLPVVAPNLNLNAAFTAPCTAGGMTQFKVSITNVGNIGTSGPITVTSSIPSTMTPGTATDHHAGGLELRCVVGADAELHLWRRSESRRPCADDHRQRQHRPGRDHCAPSDQGGNDWRSRRLEHRYGAVPCRACPCSGFDSGRLRRSTARARRRDAVRHATTAHAALISGLDSLARTGGADDIRAARCTSTPARLPSNRRLGKVTRRLGPRATRPPSGAGAVHAGGPPAVPEAAERRLKGDRRSRLTGKIRRV